MRAACVRAMAATGDCGDLRLARLVRELSRSASGRVPAQVAVVPLPREFVESTGRRFAASAEHCVTTLLGESAGTVTITFFHSSHSPFDLEAAARTPEKRSAIANAMRTVYLSR